MDTLQDACQRIGTTESSCELHSWTQWWPDTACGFQGIGGMAITEAPCTVVVAEGQACVYHNNEFAYQLQEITPALLKAIEKQEIAGQAGFLPLTRVDNERTI